MPLPCQLLGRHPVFHEQLQASLRQRFEFGVLRQWNQRATDGLVVREIGEYTVEETASQLGIRPETVKTRLHRAGRLPRTMLHDTLAAAISEPASLMGQRSRVWTRR